jgi:5,10-methylenetetrahydromethanopterin reductase
MRRVPYGVMLFTNDSVSRAVEWSKLAEELGFEGAWLLDSQLVGVEAFVTMAACAANTRTIKIAPGVTHTATRHPTVVASGFASLAQIAPGRIDLGIGYGDSAIRGLGGKPIRLAQHRQDFMMIRDLLDGKTVPLAEREIKLAWSDPALTNQIRMYSTPGSGPKSLRLAGELAAYKSGDGVVLHCDEPEIPRHLELIAEGAAVYGKQLEDLDIIWWVTTSIDNDWDKVKEHLAPRLASNVRHAYYDYRRGSLKEDELPVPVEVARKIAEEYNFLEHATANAEHGKLLEQVPEAFWRRGILAGTPAEAQAVLQRVLQDYPVFRQVVLHLPVGTRRLSIDTIMQTFAREVLPAVSSV